MIKSKIIRSRVKGLAVLAVSFISGGAAFSLPVGAVVIPQLDTSAYLGTWYEIARMDFYFERGLIRTTAEYTALPDGSIKVVNRGFDPKRVKSKKAEGVARFRSSSPSGALEVSFFGPWFAEYNIIALDDAYRYALVVGKSKKYMWILSRERAIPEDIKRSYLSLAKSLGVNVDALVWVDQTE